MAIARFTAGDSIDKDLLYRRWAGVHSGVMPAAAETRPNSHLAQVPEPGIATPAAEKPTLMNPARTTRQGRELGEPRQGDAATLPA